MYLVNSEKNNYLSFSLHELWGFKVVASIEATQARTGSEGVSSAHGLTRMRHKCTTSATHPGTLCSRDFGAPALLTESYFCKFYLIIIMFRPSSKNNIYDLN